MSDSKPHKSFQDLTKTSLRPNQDLTETTFILKEIMGNYGKFGCALMAILGCAFTRE